MSAVDVLAVMLADYLDASIERQWKDDAPQLAAASEEARAAVAELMESLAAFDGMSKPSMPGTPPNLRRLRNAYVRCTGEGA